MDWASVTKEAVEEIEALVKKKTNLLYGDTDEATAKEEPPAVALESAEMCSMDGGILDQISPTSAASVNMDDGSNIDTKAEVIEDDEEDSDHDEDCDYGEEGEPQEGGPSPAFDDFMDDDAPSSSDVALTISSSLVDSALDVVNKTRKDHVNKEDKDKSRKRKLASLLVSLQHKGFQITAPSSSQPTHPTPTPLPPPTAPVDLQNMPDFQLGCSASNAQDAPISNLLAPLHHQFPPGDPDHFHPVRPNQHMQQPFNVQHVFPNFHNPGPLPFHQQMQFPLQPPQGMPGFHPGPHFGPLPGPPSPFQHMQPPQFRQPMGYSGRPPGPPIPTPSAAPACAFCDSTEHISEQCSEYSTIESRQERRLELGRCLSCLGVHKRKKCRQRMLMKPCRTCPDGHTEHPALCSRVLIEEDEARNDYENSFH